MSQNITIVNSGGDVSGSTWLVTTSGNDKSITVTNTASINASEITTFLNAGNNVVIQTNSGNIAVNAAIAKTLSTDATLTLQASGNIDQSANLSCSSNKLNVLIKAGGNIKIAPGISINTSGGNLVLWSDSDASNDGFIWLDWNTTSQGVSINTNNGHLWMGGGGASATTWNGITVGDGVARGNATNSNGITLVKSTIQTNGGNLAFYGRGFTGNNATISVPGNAAGSTIMNATNSDGIRLHGGNSINTGTGTIYMYGYADATVGNSNGVELSQLVGSTDLITNSNATTSAIKIEGYAENNSNAANSWGFYTHLATIQNTSSGTIHLKGGGAKYSGVTIASNGAVLSASGIIKLEGTASGNGQPTVLVQGIVGQKASTDVVVSTANIEVIGSTLSLTGSLATATGSVINLNVGTLTLGALFTVGSRDIILGSNTSVSATSLYNFVTNGVGKIKRSIPSGGSFTFPISTAVTIAGSQYSVYLPVTLTNKESIAREYYLSVSNGVFTNGTSGVAVSNTIPKIDMTWNIGNDALKADPPGLDVNLTWPVTNPTIKNFLTPANLTNPTFYHYDGSKWVPLTGTPAFDPNAGTFSYSGYTGSFSPFSVAQSGSTLPVTWASFSGSKTSVGIELNWTTATEQNTKDFEVQHSDNGTKWSSIGTVAAAGNSSLQRKYTLIHRDPVSVNYYRILQRDLDAKFSYSKVIKVFNQDKKSTFSIYPNPVKDVLTIYVSEKQDVSMLNLTGIQIWKSNLSEGTHTINVGQFPRGTYILKYGDNTQKIILQ